MSDDNVFAAIAVDLSADHKAQKLRKPSFDATSIGPATETSTAEEEQKADYVSEQEPANPGFGQSWLKPSTDITRYWHGRGWYLSPVDGMEPEEDDDGKVPVTTTAEEDDGEETEAETETVGSDEAGPEEDGGTDNSIETDGAGQIWNADLHSPKKTKNKDGTWRAKKGAASAAPAEPETKPVETPPALARDDVEEFVVEAPAEAAATEDDDDDEPAISFEEVENFRLDPRQFIPDIRDALLEQFKHRPKPWSAMSQAEQTDCARTLEASAANLVQHVIEEVASGGHSAIRCLLESYTEKDGIKVTMKVQAFGIEDGERAVLFLHKARGKTVMLRLATLDEYKGDRDAKTEPDQPEIEFDADYDGDDSDLAGED